MQDLGIAVNLKDALMNSIDLFALQHIADRPG